jgi:hypothetical protein
MLPMRAWGPVSEPPKSGLPLAISLLHPAFLAPCYRTWAVVAVRGKIAYCSVEAVKLFKKYVEIGSVGNLRLCFKIELFFVCFTVKGTVLRNTVLFFNMLWRSAVYRKIR